MTNQNSTSGSQMAVPEAKAAMNRFKEEVASELGVPLKDGQKNDHEAGTADVFRTVTAKK